MKLYAGEQDRRARACDPAVRELDRGAQAIVCRPAESRADYREAFRLVYRQYLAAGLVRPNPTGLRIAPHQLDSHCTVILAEQEGRIVGTVSLVEDKRSQLPMDQLFPQVVTDLRQRGLRFTEVGCLASDDTSPQFPSAVYIELTRATIHYSRLGGYDRMIAAVHPRHGRFYRRAMGFTLLGGETTYDLVNGHAAVCVCGNPNDSSGYREPWREHFFSGAWTGEARPGRRLSDGDRRYFQGLRRIAETSSVVSIRRAA